MNGLFQELRRRNVFRVAGLYGVVGWLLIQLAIALETTLLLPAWFDTFITIVVLLGFPLALIAAWAFELTPDGLKLTHAVDPADSVTRKTGRRLDYVLIGAMLVLIAVIVGDRVLPGHGRGIAGIPSGEASIAVLPFADMSPDGDQAYFADGISEELLNALAQVSDLAVAGRTSSFAFKGRNEDLRQIGEMLSVENILEGSVRKSGNTIRVTAQLIRADNGFHVWSATYDREMDDIFEVQDEITGAILEALTPQLLGEVELVAPRTDVTAYDYYLLARQKAADGRQSGYREATAALDKALAIDPDYVPALAWRGYFELMRSDGAGAAGDIPIEEALEHADAWTARALALDPTSADALFARAGWMSMSFDPGLHEQAERYYELALEEKPNFALARNDYAYLLTDQGRMQEANDQLELALAHDPAVHDANVNLAANLIDTGQYERAETLLARWKVISPDNLSWRVFDAWLDQIRGDFAESAMVMEEAAKIDPSDPRVSYRRAEAWYLLGEFDRAAETPHFGLPVWTLLAQGRGEDAVALARQDLAERPDFPEAMLRYMSALYVSHDWQALLAYFDDRWSGIDDFADNFVEPPYLMMADVTKDAGRPEFTEMLEAAAGQIAEQKAIGLTPYAMLESEAQLALLQGNRAKGLELLEAAFEVGGRQIDMFQTPAYDELIGEPRYEALKQRVEAAVNAERAKLGLPPTNLPVPYTAPGL